MKKRIDFKHTISFIEQELSAGTFPGAALAIMVGDQLLLERYWGCYSSQTRRDLPVDASTVHMLYSFSKGITSTVFSMFLADGVVDLDAPVSRYIPEYQNGLRDRTLVRHLLTHAAGIPSAQPTAAHTEALWSEAVRVVLQSKRGSASLLQRALAVGYTRASRLIDMMTEEGILGAHRGSKSREILVTLEDWDAAQGDPLSQIGTNDE